MPKEIDMVQVRQTAEQNPLIFEMVVREGKGEPRHQVTMSRETCERLISDKHTPEHCLEPDTGVRNRCVCRKPRPFDPMKESRTVGHDGRATLLPFEAITFALQADQPTRG